MPDGPSSHLDLEVLAAVLRGHSDDLALYAGFLLNTLSAALPAELIEVRREGRLRARLAGRQPAVLGVAVTIGDHRYELNRAGLGKPPTAVLRHQSGGVVMSTRTVGVDDWSAALAADLARLARTSGATAAALARLTERHP
jgi:hypothetical protein